MYMALNYSSCPSIATGMNSKVNIFALMSLIAVHSCCFLYSQLLIYLIPAVIGVAMATFGVCSNEPPTPPSASADEEGESFYKGFLHVGTWILLHVYFKASKE